MGRWSSTSYQGSGHQELEGYGYEKGGMADFCGRPRPTLGCRASDDDDDDDDDDDGTFFE
jgi:hypothetical protein